MIITARYDLDNEGDEFDWQCSQQSVALRLAANDFSSWIRNQCKHLDHTGKDPNELVEEIRTHFYEAFSEVDFD